MKGGYFDFSFGLLRLGFSVLTEQKRACACGTLVLCTAETIAIKLCGLWIMYGRRENSLL
jgi:hypothetical protein